MRYENGLIYSKDFDFIRGGFNVENGKFSNVLCECHSESFVDLQGAYVLPGFIDMHCHGAAGFDFCESSPDGIEAAADYLAGRGVTSFAATAMTQSIETLRSFIRTASQYTAGDHKLASGLLAVRLEGPFLSFTRKGAQNPQYLRTPSIELFDELCEASDGLLRLIDLAPELPGAIELIRHASKHCIVSMGHTDADYDQAIAAIEAGASHVTHICNAMKPIHHRSPGLIPAAAESRNITAELIGDGKHVHPAVIRMIFKLFGAERLCLVSDALSCCGAGVKNSVFGGLSVHVENGLAYLEDGTIAGSARDLFDVFRISVSCGIPVKDAVRMVTYNPARILGADSYLGSIGDGKRADFIICSEDLSLRQAYRAGKEITHRV